MAAPELPVLRGERVLLRPVAGADAEGLAAILAEPAVARWWGSWDVARVRRDLLEYEGDAGLAIEAGGELVGFLQVTEEDDPDYRHAALDLFVRTADHGKGLAREAIRLVLAHLIEARGHHRVTIDPAAANERAIRTYAALGFKPVGVLRRHERAPDGSWRDGLLMDLLADEFVAL
jgi:aminoglycoside 6'-N-acetyltransferase